jgi:hypothetical protein
VRWPGRTGGTGCWTQGRYGSLGELAAAEKINRAYVSRLLELTLLTPDIQEAILEGRQLMKGVQMEELIGGCRGRGRSSGICAPSAKRAQAIRSRALRSRHAQAAVCASRAFSFEPSSWCE